MLSEFRRSCPRLGHLLPAICRVFVSVALLYFVVRRVNLEELKSTLQALRWWPIIASTAILCLRQPILGYRWKAVLSSMQIDVTVRWGTYWHMVGAFFSMFLPTSIGGDVIRVYQLRRRTRRTADSLASVFVERFLGFSIMFGTVVFGIFARVLKTSMPNLRFAMYALLGLYVGVCALLFSPVGERVIVGLFEKLRLPKSGEMVGSFFSSLRRLFRNRIIFLTALLLSAVVQYAMVLCVYLNGLSMTLDISFVHYLVAVPIVWLATMLPVSINGVGVREGAFVALFATGTTGRPEALALSFIFFAQTILIAAVGGVLHIFHPFLCKRKPDQGKVN